MEAERTTRDEFCGSLNSVLPKRIIREEQDDVSDAFLALAEIYNDLDGIGVFANCLVHHYQQPNQDEVSFHSGKYGGLMIHVQKLYAATIRGFMEFLEKNNEVISSPQFQAVVARMPSDRRRVWHDMVNVANGAKAPITPILRVIERIRHTVTAHYKHSGELLHQGYVRHFFESPKNSRNEKAYYALGESHAKSRIFYADAAVEAYLNKLIVDDVKLPIEEYRQDLNRVIKTVGDVLHHLQKAYLKKIRYP